MKKEISQTDKPAMQYEPVLCDVFGDALLKTLNSVYEKFKIIKRIGNIYILAYGDKKYNGEIPKEGGTIDVLYPDTDIVIVDKSCVVPYTREDAEKLDGWKKAYDNPEWLKGHTIGCKIFAELFRVKQNIT